MNKDNEPEKNPNEPKFCPMCGSPLEKYEINVRFDKYTGKRISSFSYRCINKRKILWFFPACNWDEADCRDFWLD